MSPQQLPLSRTGKTPQEVVRLAIQEAGVLLRDNFYAEKEVRSKGRGNLVTNLDHLVEERTIELLRKEYPHWGVISEEQAEPIRGEDAYTWILDPVDGTRNYAAALPFYSVALALVKDDQVLLGATYDPMRDELFWAELGKGATLNGQPIHVSAKKTVNDSVLALDMSYMNETAGLGLKMLGALWPGMQSIRIMGSAALGLCYAACGRVDLYFHPTLAPWDMAGGILIVREAGGVTTDRQGKPITYRTGEAIASNRDIHADFMALTEGMEWRVR